MAIGKTFKIGGTLINVSGRGIATKNTSTGEIKRHAFPWAKPKPAPEPERDDAYDENGAYPPDDGYNDEAYADENYDAENYDEGAYEDDNYEDDAPVPESGGVLGASWFMWLMLIVLPPLGIWLLWKRNRYEFTVRSALSVASVIWFIIALVWLFSRFGGSDTTTPPPITGTPLPSVEASASPTPTPSATPTAVPSPTPNTSGVTETGTDGEPVVNPLAQAQFVYSMEGGKNYHSNATCSNMTNASRVTLSIALSRNQTACPKCFTAPSATPTAAPTGLPAGSYYSTPTGKNYHSLPNCNGMKSAQMVTLAEALARNQTACPDCVGSVYMTDGGKSYHINSDCQGMKGARLVTVDEATTAGKTACSVCMGEGYVPPLPSAGPTTDSVYYCTDKGSWYHADKNCQGMTNAYSISAAAAEQKGKTACPDCLGGNSGVANYYATEKGSWYHTDKSCQGMKDASRISLATAIAKGKTACPKCAGGVEGAVSPQVVTVNAGTDTGKTDATIGAAGTYYSTVDGTYFHKTADCKGMKNATTVTAAQIAERGQKPCPKCIGTSGIYYSTPNGDHYHSKDDCSGMKDADIVTLAMIKSRSQTPCPKCIGSSDGETGNYFCTSSGKYYHSKSDCSGMKNAKRTTQADAEKNGKKPCPTCVGSVYSAGGKYYHKDKTCDGMKNAKLVTIQAAEKAGQTACPKCIGGTTAGTAAPETDDDSNRSYYATSSGDHYHRNATCSGMKNAEKISESEAKAQGKTPCPTCIGTVYATSSGDYYHSNATCGGMKNAKLMTVDQAELSGHAPCPTCMGGSKVDSAIEENGGSSDSGTSDGNTTSKYDDEDPIVATVYVTLTGTKYHSKSGCSEMESDNVLTTSLNWAQKNGYTACSACN